MRSFLTICGLTDSLRLVIEKESDAEGELRLLHQPFAIIGRDQRADLVLDHGHVSRRHVYLQVVDGQVFWVDLESRRGTRRDGEVQRSGWLDADHSLGIGPFLIRRFGGDSLGGGVRRQDQSQRAVPLVAGAHGHAQLPEVALEFLNGPSQSTAWPVRRVMSLIGSARGCKFRLTDPSVSRFHASLLRTSVGLWIVDLLGQGGIAVNDVPRRFSYLDDGDQLRIGRYQVRVRYRAGRQESVAESSETLRPKPVTQRPREEARPKRLMLPDRVAAPLMFVPPVDGAARPEMSVAIHGFSSLAKVDVPTSESIFSVKLAPAELSESMLVPLVNQFGVMQQQMFDQFQQAMAMMVQMFGTMHRDQMAVIREELDRLRDLTEEFHALKTELVNRTARDQNPSTSNGPMTTAQDENRILLAQPMVSEKRLKSDRSSLLQSGQEDTASSNQPISLAPPSDSQPQSFTPPDLTSQSASMKPPTVPPNGEGARDIRGPQCQIKVGATCPPADSERDSVAWLHNRIMTLQRERETRWEKILKLLPGLS
jgi:pSer/pThr/pTyr-binding forkhead associated (FHA) protein